MRKLRVEPQLGFTKRELEFLLVEVKAFFELPMFSKNLNCTALLILKALFCFEKRKWDQYLHLIAVSAPASSQTFRPRSGNFLSYMRYRSGLQRVPITDILINLKELVYEDSKHFFRATHS